MNTEEQEIAIDYFRYLYGINADPENFPTEWQEVLNVIQEEQQIRREE